MQFIAKTHINHDGIIYEPGAVLDLSSQESEPLVRAGDVVPIDVPFSKKINVPLGVKS